MAFAVQRLTTALAFLAAAFLAFSVAQAQLTPEQARRALEAAADRAPPPNADLAPQIASNMLKLEWAVDVSNRRDVFGQLEALDALSSAAKLQDGRYVRWRYLLSSGNVQKPSGLGELLLGSTAKSVGLPVAAAVGTTTTKLPSRSTCDVVDAVKLRSVTNRYGFVAACSPSDGAGGTNLIAYDDGGHVADLGHHPLQIKRVGSNVGVHGAPGSLLLLLRESDSKLYLQSYRWTAE